MNISKRTAAVVLSLVLIAGGVAACEGDDPGSNSKAQSTGQKLTEDAFAKAQATVPYPADALTDSLERRNLREKLLRYNSPSKISYIYLLSANGGIYSYFTIKGKVSSNQSQMTTDNLVILDKGTAGGGNTVVSAPGDDSSYGPNEPGIFFFTTDGVMVTWDGPYLLTDAPMKINSQNFVLQYQEGSKPSNTSTIR